MTCLFWLSLLFSFFFCDQVVHPIHLVCRWARETNSHRRTMALTVSPGCSPLDQGASSFLSFFWMSVGFSGSLYLSLCLPSLFLCQSFFLHSSISNVLYVFLCLLVPLQYLFVCLYCFFVTLSLCACPSICLLNFWIHLSEYLFYISLHMVSNEK